MDMYLFEKPYRTINGEAEHIGKPCIFVRFQGCTVGCKWCDAMGTWPKPNEANKENWFTNETLANYLTDNFEKTPRVWITGGEPMEHKEEIRSFIEYCADYMYEHRIWHLITSGSVYDEKVLNLFDHITVDIKPPSARANKNAANNSFIDLCMEHMSLQDKLEFKMVVSNTTEDIEFAKNQIDKLSKYGRDITIQPLYWSEAEVKKELKTVQLIKNSKTFIENFQQPTNWESYGEFAEYFMDNPYENLRVLPQLHKIYWPGEMNGI
jgi:organic radical activating enzyme